MSLIDYVLQSFRLRKVSDEIEFANAALDATAIWLRERGHADAANEITSEVVMYEAKL